MQHKLSKRSLPGDGSEFLHIINLRKNYFLYELFLFLLIKNINKKLNIFISRFKEEIHCISL